MFCLLSGRRSCCRHAILQASFRCLRNRAAGYPKQACNNFARDGGVEQSILQLEFVWTSDVSICGLFPARQCVHQLDCPPGVTFPKSVFSLCSRVSITPPLRIRQRRGSSHCGSTFPKGVAFTARSQSTVHDASPATIQHREP